VPDYLTSDVWDEYLPGDVRPREDLDFLVSEAERQLVQHFTRRKEDVRFRVGAIVDDMGDGTDHIDDIGRDTAVFLRYYKPKAANIDTSDDERRRFVEAMRTEIARLVRHKAEHDDRQEGVTSVSQGSRSVSYESGQIRELPKGFGKALQPFDLRPKSIHI